MVGVPVPVTAYKQFWTDKRLSLNTQYKDTANKYPDATPSIQQLPISVGKSKEWAAIISSAEDNRGLL
jgi:hypothetical protein